MATRRVVTVFGGSGFIGRYVVQRLARLDYVVRVPTRIPDRVRPLITQGRVGQIVPLGLDLGDDAEIARTVQGAEVVINLVGILAERRPGDFQRLQAEAAGRIARAAAAAGVSRLVQLSAIGAENGSDSLYARSKAAGEDAVRAGFPGATILRPSIVFGPEDQFFNRFAGLSRVLPVLPVVGAATRFQPVYVGDVADAVIAAITREDTPGKTYELAGPRVATFRELMEMMLDIVGRRRRVVEVPAGLARLQARLGEFLPNPPLTRDQILLLQHDNVPSGRVPGLQELGIVPHSLESILPGYLNRFRPGGGRRRTRTE
ncbi:complex I NDUFA9 subunit family protein [Roseomonas sp. BN140053]|uniref:complex I NDUFA9 subunit family protein n=1 Tax=Roseomonas sp. BN140053 TaxID=3391898 RepID=UPI0039EA0607